MPDAVLSAVSVAKYHVVRIHSHRYEYHVSQFIAVPQRWRVGVPFSQFRDIWGVPSMVRIDLMHMLNETGSKGAPYLGHFGALGRH